MTLTTDTPPIRIGRLPCAALMLAIAIATATAAAVAQTSPCMPSALYSLTGGCHPVLTFQHGPPAGAAYEIRRGDNLSSPYAIGTTTTLQYTDNSPSPGNISYWARITTCNSIVYYLGSTTSPGAPHTPNSTTITAGVGSTALVHWSAAAAATSYTVCRGPNPFPAYAAALGTTTATSFLDTNVPPGIYYYWVRTTTPCGTSPLDSNWYFETPRIWIDTLASAAIGSTQVFQINTAIPFTSYLFDISVLGSAPGFDLPGGLHVPLNPPLLSIDSGYDNPSVFGGFAGTTSASGSAIATVAIPLVPSLAGYVLTASAVTVDPSTPSGFGRAAMPHSTVILGGPPTNPVPTILAISPAIGPTAGATLVGITGQGFQPGVEVYFGSAAATVSSASGTMITCISPAHAAGLVDVTIVNVDLSAATAPAAFTFVTPPS